MKNRYLLLWMMIFVAGCSTLPWSAVGQPSSTGAGPAPGTKAPYTADANKTNRDELENGGTAAADQGTEKTQTPAENPESVEDRSSSQAGGDFTNNRVEKDEEYFIPSPLLPYDGIAPVYEPQFVAAAESPLVEDELVMGVSIDGESKAYPVSVLRFREMVNDDLGGLPVLVTW